jgi:hypothetical protein
MGRIKGRGLMCDGDVCRGVVGCPVSLCQCVFVSPSLSIYLSVCLSVLLLRANSYRVTIEGGGVVGGRRQRTKQSAGGWLIGDRRRLLEWEGGGGEEKRIKRREGEVRSQVCHSLTVNLREMQEAARCGDNPKAK